MIIKGRPIKTYRQHGLHLLKRKREGIANALSWNDEVELVCCYNLASGDDVPGCLREMAAVAVGSKCERFLYAASISPDRAGGHELNHNEAEEAARALLESLGFSGDHQWLLVRHRKEGRSHYHIAANRVDPVLLKAVDLSWNYPKQEIVARKLETRFNLIPTRGAFTGRKKGKNGRFEDERPISLMSSMEAQQAVRTQITVDSVIADFCEVWEAVTSPASHTEMATGGDKFAELLRQHGYTLAKGDRRDLVVLDFMGGVHSPARRLGLKAAEFRKVVGDLDLASLPTVNAVREQLKRLSSVESDPDGQQVPASLDRVSEENMPERSSTSMQGRLQ